MGEFPASATTEIGAPPHVVWRTLTDPAAIEAFMLGARVETDWRAGSAIVWRGVRDGRPFEDTGEIVAVQPGRRLVVTHFGPQADRPESHHTLTYALEASDAGTVLTLTQDGNATQDAADHAQASWRQVLADVKEVAEGGLGVGRIVLSENVSLDGVAQDPAGAEGFERGGWVGVIPARRMGAAQFLVAEALGSEALLLGRRTYEFFAARWPSRDGALADRLNAMPKHVVSSTLEVAGWNNSTVVDGDVVEEVSKLKRETRGDIVVYGSLRLARTLLEHELVDELRLMVYPVVLGAGERLFGETTDGRPLRLVDHRTLDDGVLVLTYVATTGQRAREDSNV